MKSRALGAGASIILFFAAAPASAEEPYYFHKSGVGREQYMNDVNECAQLAGEVRVSHYQAMAVGPNMAVNAIATGIGSFFSTLAEGRERRRLISRVERTCMADKGYNRRSIDKAQFAGIKKMDDATKIESLFALVSAEQPSGKALVE